MRTRTPETMSQPIDRSDTNVAIGIDDDDHFRRILLQVANSEVQRIVFASPMFIFAFDHLGVCGGGYFRRIVRAIIGYY